MILQCPSCKARFLVPDNAIGPAGRTVRCGKCRHSWHCDPVAETPKPPGAPDIDTLMRDGSVPVAASATPRPRPVPPGSNLPVKHVKPVSKRLLAALFLLIFLTAGLAALKFAPAKAGIYPSAGIALAEVQFQPMQEPPAELASTMEDLYRLEGHLLNTTTEDRAAPEVRVTLMNAQGVTLQTWKIKASAPIVIAGDSAPFALDNIPVPKGGGTKLRLDLGNALELMARPAR